MMTRVLMFLTRQAKCFNPSLQTILICAQAGDITFMDDLATWTSTTGTRSIFYWAWNANSGDTGGIVGDDWRTVWSHLLLSEVCFTHACPLGLSVEGPYGGGREDEET